MTTWLERYQRGERAAVWLELRQLGDRVREPGHVEEATRVCDEMARRARHDVEVLVERMTGAGVRFHAGDPESGAFTLPVAPDRLTKDDVSGGSPYGFVLPDGSADALFVGETTQPFVSYLNDAFAHGGLPWTADADGGWWAWRQELARDLLPL